MFGFFALKNKVLWVGAPAVGWRRVGRPKNFALDFPAPAQMFALGLPLWGSSPRIFGAIFEGQAPHQCTFAFSGPSRETPGGLREREKSTFWAVQQRRSSSGRGSRTGGVQHRAVTSEGVTTHCHTDPPSKLVRLGGRLRVPQVYLNRNHGSQTFLGSESKNTGSTTMFFFCTYYS